MCVLTRILYLPFFLHFLKKTAAYKKAKAAKSIKYFIVILLSDFNSKTRKWWTVTARHRSSITSSQRLENKAFIAIYPPYPLIWFHAGFPFSWLLIRAYTRAEKSHSRIYKCGSQRTVTYVHIYYTRGFWHRQVYLYWKQLSRQAVNLTAVLPKPMNRLRVSYIKGRKGLRAGWWENLFRMCKGSCN